MRISDWSSDVCSSDREPTIGKSIGMKYPAFHYTPTKRMDLVEEQFGVKVADTYRWLENDVRQDNEVRAWIDAENAVTQNDLQTLPGRNRLEESRVGEGGGSRCRFRWLEYY